MIGDSRYQPEKWYTEMARVISTLQLRNQLSVEEAAGLFGILDLICKEHNAELIMILGSFVNWPGCEETRELDEIIKATLIGINFKSAEDVEQNIGILGDLILEREKIRSRVGQQGG